MSDDDLASVGPIEDGLDRRQFLASAYEIGAGAGADQQVDGFDEHRFAGAGFPGQQVQARFELDLELIDDRQVAHGEEAKHGGTGTAMISNL